MDTAGTCGALDVYSLRHRVLGKESPAHSLLRSLELFSPPETHHSAIKRLIIMNPEETTCDVN
jgi:hypothetical protein